MKKDKYGVFEVVVPALEGKKVAIPHNSKVKVRLSVFFLFALFLPVRRAGADQEAVTTFRFR
jgi:mannitol/fructose-specific phosphotransferase system IIA component (Ntr-type)